MFKKFISTLLCLALCLLPAAIAEATPPTLKVWAIRSSAIQDYATNRQSVYMEELTGIKVDWADVPASGWASAYQTFVLSGEEADVHLYNYDTTEVTMLAEAGILIPLENLIEEHAPNIKAILDGNPEIREAITAPDGHIYTLFNSAYGITHVPYSQKLWVNAAWLEAYEAATGCAMPRTLDELTDMLVYFAGHDMNNNGVSDEIPYMGNNGTDGTYFFANAFIPSNSSGNGYGTFVDESGERIFAYTHEDYKKALEFLHNLYASGLFSSDSFSISSSDRFKYTSGTPDQVRVGVVCGADINNIVQLTSEEGSLDYSSYIAIPPLESVTGRARGFVTAAEETVGLRGAISSSCSDPVTAIKWLDAGYSEEMRLYAIHGGLEGEDWRFVEGETVTGPGQVVEYIGNPDAENSSWKGQGIVYSVRESDFLQMNANDIGTNAALATYRANLAYRPYAIQANWPSIVWVDGENADSATEYSQINQLIKSCVTEFYTAVILGEKNLEADWEAYVAELDDIGVDRYVELVDLYCSAG